jgi:prepilin-type N-terminal cleavage/methylation domain-containing protein
MIRIGRRPAPADPRFRRRSRCRWVAPAPHRGIHSLPGAASFVENRGLAVIRRSAWTLPAISVRVRSWIPPPPTIVLQRSRPPRGFTLAELLLVVTLVALLAALAVPPVSGVIRRIRMQMVLDTLTRDLFYARTVAIRSGRRVDIRFFESEPACVDRYAIVRRDPETVVKQVRVRDLAGSNCLRKNAGPTLTFNSRGRPNWNLSLWMREGTVADSMTVNQLGRVHRWR